MKWSPHKIARWGLFCLISLALPSCLRSEGLEDDFLTTESICLLVNGKVVHSYDPLTWQLSYTINTGSYVFRANNDSMSEYFTLSCSEQPSMEGQKISCTLTWTSSTGISSRTGLNFTVSQVSATGLAWLWCEKYNIGVCVQVLD